MIKFNGYYQYQLPDDVNITAVNIIEKVHTHSLKGLRQRILLNHFSKNDHCIVVNQHIPRQQTIRLVKL